MWLEAVLVALIVAGGTFGGLWLTGLQAAKAKAAESEARSREKKEDWKRLDEVKHAAEETARLLAETTSETQSKLTVIHDIVNSDRTALLETLRVALVAQRLVLLRDPTSED